MIYRLTKSKFILGLQCEKALYLDVYKPNLAYYPPETLARFRKGRDFEAKVKALFPNAIDISRQQGWNIQRYPELTARMLEQPGEVNLYEAGFVYNEVLVLADIVHKDADGNISIYEVKNSLSVKDVFRRDVSIQHYVISHCLNNINSFTIIYNDGEDIPVYEELLPEAQEAEPLIVRQVERFKDILQGMEPQVETGTQCTVPYECPYARYCNGNVSAQLELGGF
ncbi:MAG: hypothetical protein IKP34_03035 [Bacteroidales bacterium]|nr:hypothetical protein [Bacteroidales bacterium]